MVYVILLKMNPDTLNVNIKQRNTKKNTRIYTYIHIYKWVMA